ncbi:MAG TPA: tetratricopeptide repeat protein [Steroidobacteraceae bacterium]|jgi:tetratricopeptide (TPR) repeat protein
MHVYGTRDLQRLLGIGPSSVRSFIRAGHVRPRKGARGRLQFTFQDLIILRTARTLSGANVPTRRLNRCLRELRKALPADIPLSGLSITAIGDQVAVREGRQHWDTESRQYLLALDVSVESGEVQVIAREAPVAADGGGVLAKDVVANHDCASQYDRAYELEDDDPEAAIAAYQRCIDANGDHLEARTNCGRLLHLAGRLAEAEKIYRGATEPDGTVLFNLAVLLEDSGREDEALEVYAQALEMDPELADAHFNLARLHERAGNRRESFRHLLAYKRASD